MFVIKYKIIHSETQLTFLYFYKRNNSVKPLENHDWVILGKRGNNVFHFYTNKVHIIKWLKMYFKFENKGYELGVLQVSEENEKADFFHENIFQQDVLEKEILRIIYNDSQYLSIEKDMNELMDTLSNFIPV